MMHVGLELMARARGEKWPAGERVRPVQGQSRAAMDVVFLQGSG